MFLFLKLSISVTYLFMHMGKGVVVGGYKLLYTYSDSSDGEESTQTCEVVIVRNNRCCVYSPHVSKRTAHQHCFRSK